MAVTASTTKKLNVPVDAIWDVLADFQNIDKWTDSVKTATNTGDLETGVGAKRMCELAPAGTVNEEVVEFVPNQKLRIAIDDTKTIPVRTSDSTFALNSVGPDATEVTFTSVVEPKGGIFSGLIGKRLEKGLPKAQASILDDLGVEAARRAAARS